MGVSVHHNDTLYLSSKEASRVSGYTSDYISRLARQGKIAATRIGTQWFVDPKSLDSFLQFAEESKDMRSEQLRIERLRERESDALVAPRSVSSKRAIEHADVDLPATYSAHRTAVVAVALGFAVAFVASLGLDARTMQERIVREARVTAYGFYELTTARPAATAMLSAVGTHGGNGSGQAALPASAPVAQGGLVILPHSVATATVEYIRDSFSDEVHVALDEGGATGVITPVFSDGAGEPYKFVLVPLTSTPP